MKAMLCRIDAWSGDEATALRLASHDDERICHLDGATWLPAIARLPTLRYDLFDGSFDGDIITPTGDLDISLDAFGDLPGMALHDCRVRLWRGTIGAAWSSYAPLFDGRVREQPAITDGIAKISIGADDSWLRQVLLDTYAGSGGAEGSVDLGGNVKLLLFGAPRFVEGVLVDAVDNIYQLSNGAIQQVEVAFDQVVRFGAPIANYANFAALKAANVPSGAWATCLPGGFVRLGAPPVGPVTFHVRGDNGGTRGWVRRAGSIIHRIAEIKGALARVNIADLDALDTACPWNLSPTATEQVAVGELIQSIAQSVNAVAFIDWLGVLRVKRVAMGTAAGTLAADGSSLPPVAGGVEQIGVEAPWWRIAQDAEVTHRVHNPGEMALADLDAIITATAFPNAAASRYGQMLIRSDLGNRIFFRVEGDGLLRVNDDIVTVNGDPIEMNVWIEITDDRLLEALGDAAAAQAVADLAWDMANSAIDAIDLLDDDGVLSSLEKRQVLIPKSGELEVAYAQLVALAATLSVSTTAAATARTNWLNYLNGLSPPWNDTGTDTAVARGTFGGFRDAYDAALEALQKAISTAIKARADTAQTDATSALSELGRIASDGWLSRGEKPQVQRDYDALYEEWQALDGKATSMGIANAQRTAANAAMSALYSYLNGLSPSWTDVTQNTAIVAATFSARWADAYSTVAALQAAIQGQPGADGMPGGVPTLIANNIGGGTIIIEGDKITKAGAQGQNASVYSQEAYGTFYLRAQLITVGAFSVGVSTSPPTTASGLQHGFINSSTAGADVIRHNGANVWTGDFPAGAALEMVGDGRSIRYYINGALIHSGTAGVEGSWQFVAAIDTAGGALGGLRWGPSGPAGADGLSIAELTVYRRAASQPSTPLGGTYNFATKTLSPPSGWTTTWPTTGSGPIWSASGVASIQGTSGTATPSWYGVGGGISDGSTGESGYSVAQIKLYRRLATQPALPTATLTYTFATDTLSGSLGNWSRTQPADNGLPLWVTSAVASSQGASDTIGIAEWVTPVIEGQTPPKTAIAFIYKRTSTSGGGPLPTGTATYTFATGAITGLNNSWSSDIPSGSAPLYRCQAAALSNGNTASIGGGDWGPAQLMAQDGAAGTPGEATNIIFRRAASQPATPSPSSGVPSSWYDDTGSVPTGAGYIWASFGTRATPSSNWAWQTPKKVEGTDGVSPLSIIANPPSVTIQGAAGGAPKPGELPTAVAISAKRGGSAVTVSSISVTGTDNCSASVSGTSVRFTAAGASGGSATISVTAGGETQAGIIIPITVVPAGADGSTSATKNYTSPQITSTSYTAYTPALAINASDTGKIQVSGSALYRVTLDGMSQLRARGKLQISTNGSSWTDIAGSETVGTLSENLFEPAMVRPGRITFPTLTMTGLTAGGAYQVRLQLCKDGAFDNSATMSAAIVAERVT